MKTPSLLCAFLIGALLLCACDDEQPQPHAGADTGAEDLGGEDPGDMADLEEADGGDLASDLVDEPEPPAPFCGDRSCQPELEDEDSCPRDCSAAPTALYDPFRGDFFSYPDDFFTVEDSTPTGLRVQIDDDFAILDITPPLFRLVFDDLSTLDGFGVSAGGFLRMSRPLDPASLVTGPESATRGPVVMGYLDAEGVFVRVPVDLSLTDEGSTVVARPMAPLPPQARALLGLTREATGLDGLPAMPGRVQRSLWDGSAEGKLARMVERHEEALAALQEAGIIEGEEDMAALTVFTTQSTYTESREIAADIKTRPHSVAQRLGCTEEARYRRCTFTFMAGNYRDAAQIVAWDSAQPGPQAMYEIPVEVYLPLEANEQGQPYPVTIFGHGLGGQRTQAARLADFSAPLGMATISIDAAEHGDHPAATGVERVSKLLRFFGFGANGLLSARALRDNWRQSTYDKLALVEALKAGVDVDGDGELDLDGERITYLGVSLGGIMGPELLAMSEDVGAAVLVVSGARVTDILQFSEMLGPIGDVLRPTGVTEGDVVRFFPILQTVVDRGDPVAYAPHVVHDRLVGQRGPDVLMAMVLDDDTVPEPTNFAMARALRIPHVPPVYRDVPLLEIAPAPPLSQNLPDGVTAGLVQLDLIEQNGQWRTATHNNVGDSNVGAETWLRFLDGWLRDGSAVIVDPYESLGLVRP